MNSLYLDKDKWDLQLDEAGNIKIAKDEYAIAQNCANAIRLFTEDAFFNRTSGIPQLQIDLGQKDYQARPILTNRIRKACFEVEGVQECEPQLEFNEDTRVYGGDITIKTEQGTSINIEL